MTDEDFISWLKDQSAVRCALIEVNVLPYGGSEEETRYLSSRGYVTSPSESPANTVYTPIISGGISFKESIDVSSGNISINYGDIELKNIRGDIDSWVDDYWAGRNINVYVGDVGWPRDDFRQVFGGVVASINISSRTTITLKIADKLQKLNTTISEQKLGGLSSQADNLIPLTFGEVFNVTPLLIDSNNQVYQVHDGEIESVIEVRDNGVPVGATQDILSGTFTLDNAPVGTITTSIQGEARDGYANHAASIIRTLVIYYGLAENRFVPYEDIDEDNFSEMSSAYPSPCGFT
jgi:hypothetical protein